MWYSTSVGRERREKSARDSVALIRSVGVTVGRNKPSFRKYWTIVPDLILIVRSIQYLRKENTLGFDRQKKSSLATSTTNDYSSSSCTTPRNILFSVRIIYHIWLVGLFVFFLFQTSSTVYNQISNFFLVSKDR